MKTIFTSLVFATCFAAHTQAATYNIDLTDFGQAGATLTGTMTFDSFGDGVGPSSFDLIYTFTPMFDPFYSPITLTNTGNGFAQYSGGLGLVAGPSALTFDMSSAAVLEITDDVGISGSPIGFCIGGANAQNCAGSANVIEEGGIISTSALSGTVTLGTLQAVPLPAGGALALTGLAVFAGLRRRKRLS